MKDYGGRRRDPKKPEHRFQASKERVSKASSSIESRPKSFSHAARNTKKHFEFNVDIEGNYGIESRFINGELTIILNGSLHWNSFLIISSYINNELKKYDIKAISINLTNTISAIQNGVLPLVALLDLYKGRGLKTKVFLPKSHDIKAVFNNHNWSHYLDSQFPKAKRSFPRSTGIMLFTDFNDLNDAINKAIRVALKGQIFEDGALNSLDWSLNEITDNVVRHSGSTKGWFEVTWQADGDITFTVADNGVGIPKTMRDTFPELEDDASAIHRAIEKGDCSAHQYSICIEKLTIFSYLFC
ncbi:ATP-binding protein [Deinococcus radiomollis]|uniref:ATP-binding protein n=1 Tax=Deinococcus radiomollis TaxID=468916 RepID=UPI00389294DD